jgi:phosphohistidine phosphatase SixA
MANNIAFQPMGKTYKLNAATTVQQLTLYSDSPVQQYMLVSHEPTGGAGLPVYVRISNSATANVALPGNGSPSYSVIVPPDTVMVVTGPQSTNTAPVYVSFVSETGTPEVYVTPGEGL